MYETSYYDLFDTATVIRGYASSADDFQKGCDMIYEELLTCHRLFDIYNEYEGINNLRTVNKNAGISNVKTDQRVIELLEYAKLMYDKTDKALDISMGALLDIWKEYRDRAEEVLPEKEELAQARLHSSIDSLVIDHDQSTVYIEDKLMSLDVGAIAKGYACERVLALMPDTEISAAVINLGGNVAVYGKKPNGGGDWSIGVNSPFDKGELLSFKCSDLSAVTSGDYQRYYLVNGVKYHHIIDPSTMYPGRNFTQVTVIAESPLLGDALSTALFVTDLEKGEQIADSFGVAVIWVTPDNKVFKNERAKELTL